MPGPNDAGAAMAMGNSASMWDKVYDRAFRRREMQQAVDAMGQWREAAVCRQSCASVPHVHINPNADTNTFLSTNVPDYADDVDVDLSDFDSDKD